MRIVQGSFFGKITQTSDKKTSKTFFHYYIGQSVSRELIFEGAAGDEQEAVATVKAHLGLLARPQTPQEQRKTRAGSV